MTGLGAALLAWLAAAAPDSVESSEGPKASVRLLGQVTWRRDEPYGVPPPEVYLDLSKRPFESLELALRAAVALGPVLAPVDGTLDVIARWRPGEWAPEEGVWAQVSPLGSTRLQLGFDPLLRVGARVPGQTYPLAMAVGMNREQWRVWAGLKSIQLLNELTHEPERSHSVFVEGAWSSPRHWNVAVSGAYVPGGHNQALASQGIREQSVMVAGAGRVIYRSAGEIGAPLDLDRVRSTPWGNESLFALAPARPPPGVEVVVEGTLGEQWLADPLQPMVRPQVVAGGAASVRASVVDTRLQVGAVVRTPGLLVADQFGFSPLPPVPFTRFPDGAARWDDLWLEASADRELAGTGFTPGALVRYRRPGGIVADLGAPHTVVLDYLDGPEILPDAGAPHAEWTAMLTGLWRPAPFVGVFGMVGYEYDANRVVFSGVTGLPVWAPAHVYRLHGAAQVAF